ncbi:MAG: DUF2277 domain-containing protein [Vicinamibacterales bacterium]
MCRNVKRLFNLDPPATDDEIRASALQFVRKVSGSTHPSRANQEAFGRAVNDVAEAAARLVSSLSTSASPRSREDEAGRARRRRRARFG